MNRSTFFNKLFGAALAAVLPKTIQPPQLDGGTVTAGYFNAYAAYLRGGLPPTCSTVDLSDETWAAAARIRSLLHGWRESTPVQIIKMPENV